MTINIIKNIKDKINTLKINNYNKPYRILKNGTLILKNGVTEINRSIFNNINEQEAFIIKKIILPKSVKKIGDSAFKVFYNLESINIPNNVTSIGDFVFAHKHNLKEIQLPNNLVSIGEGCFYNSDLNKIVLPNSLIDIGSNAFGLCEKLEKLIIPDSVKKISILQINIFSTNSTTLKSLSIPINLYLNPYNSNVLKNIVDFELRDGEKRIKIKSNNIYTDNEYNLYTLDNGTKIIVNKNSTVKIYKLQDYEHKITKWNELDDLHPKDFIKMTEWLKYNTIPNKIVVVNMNKKDIPLFYKDNNTKNWMTLTKYADIKNPENKTSLFKIAYALGVISDNGKESIKAVNYVKENILDKFNENEIHNMFNNLNTYYVGYDQNFAKFFMLYFKENPQFMIKKLINGETINLLSSCYISFNDIIKNNPTKMIITRQDKDRLTPKIVMDSLLNIKYKNIKEDEKELAEICNTLGISEYDFEKAQEIFQQAKQIPEEKISLKIKSDEAIDKNIVNYELLNKKNPLGIVLGNITNCCQIIGGAGEECMEYGMTQPNSGFLVFRYQGQIIGQAWVWYDEKTKTICLDNIEVPTIYLTKIKTIPTLQREFIDCLNRASNNFIEAMGINKVHKITVGLRYNDVVKILKQNFEMDKKTKLLTNYNGYTDAKHQLVLKDLEKN